MGNWLTVSEWLRTSAEAARDMLSAGRPRALEGRRRVFVTVGIAALVAVASCTAITTRSVGLSLGFQAQTQSLEMGSQAAARQEEAESAPNAIPAQQTRPGLLFDRVVDLPPRVTDSYYLHTTESSTLNSLGCSGGEQTIGQRPGQDDLIILQFGAPKQKNLMEGAHLYEPAGLPSTGFATMAQVSDAAQSFVAGYVKCADPTARLTVVLGTTNWGSNVTRFHGVAWGNMVKKAAASVAETPYAKRVSVLGGADLEMDWNRPATTRAWLDAYVATGAPTLIQYGDAGGCPTSENGSQKCNNGWALDDIWYISWGTGGTMPMPQIYNVAMAKQWALLKRYSLTKQDRPPMVIAGILTMAGNCRQVGGCGPGFDLEPAEAYRQLTGFLRASPATEQHITYASDIKLAWRP